MDELLVLYDSYRTMSRDIVSRLGEAYLSREAVQEAARVLGIDVDGVLVFRDEEEPVDMFDLAFFDVRVDGMSSAEAMLSSDDDLSELDVTILEAMTTARASLFRVKECSWPFVILVDLLDGGEVRLVNRSMSATVHRGSLVFLRVVDLPELSIASGSYLAFPGEMKKTLLTRFRALEPEVPSEDPVVRRFAAFAALHEAYGVESITID